LLTRAAAIHADLLRTASSQHALRHPLQPLIQFLDGSDPPALKRQLLLHPLLIEALHHLASLVPEIAEWHEAVTAHETDDSEPADVTRASLGTIALSVLLHADSRWCGTWTCATDVIGQLGFPFSDWTLQVADRAGNLQGRRLVQVVLTPDIASCCLVGDNVPFLVLSHDDFVQLLVHNEDSPRDHVEFPHSHYTARLRRADAMEHSGIRFDPVGVVQPHAGMTGGLVQAVVNALRRHSPSVYREFCRFIHTVRGFEFFPTVLPRATRGTIGSFSDPSLPGVLGVNVSYTPDHRPCLDPFCFTWLGHEMGHTKNYLVDTILYGEGETLLFNPAERTAVLPRYGRSFTMRTLFQIPYVHLYEWVLLMDFFEGSFRALPWQVPDQVESVGRDLIAEIDEAFDLIPDVVQLTAAGESACEYFQQLTEANRRRWQRLGFSS
jgi:hypothetical protein